MKIVVYNIGCKVNQSESDSLINALRKLGHTVTCEIEAADAYIINTCAVTQEAEKKSRQCVARMKKYNPSADIYVIGCASEKNIEQFATKGVKYVAGVAKKHLVTQFPNGATIYDLPKEYESLEYGDTARSRSYVKVQDGCNNFCSYCIIPYLRGRSRSRDLGDIIVECNMRALDTDEIVLTGINLSCYGKDIGLTLVDLVKAVGDVSCRFRLGSLEINAIDTPLLQAIKNSNICPHFHLSLQSGDDNVLKSMNRHYTREQFLKKVRLIRKFFPNAAITTDIIVGFPTEDDAAFANTLQLSKKAEFSDIHIFPYSRRQKTAAYSLKSLPDEIIKKRVEELTALKDELKREYLTMFIGRELKVIAESADDRFIVGYSENYIRVYIPYLSTPCIGKIYTIVADNIYKDGLIARRK